MTSMVAYWGSTEAILKADASIADKVRALIAHCGRPVDTAQDQLRVAAEITDSLGRHVCTPATNLTAPEPMDWSPPVDSVTIADPRFRVVPLQDFHSYVVFGDLHGDYNALTSMLRSAFPLGMSDEQASRTHIISLGDLLDRGARDLNVLHLTAAMLDLLGDRYIQMRGNHEELSIEDGLPETTVHGDANEIFVSFYADKLPDDFFRALVGYFEWAPHLVLMTHERGGVALMHAGVPPAFLQRRYPPAQWMSVENIRRGVLWGRGPLHPPRPKRPYPYDTFFCEDVDDFCRAFGVNLLVRGHDVQCDGYSLTCDRRCMTLFSSGNAMRGLAGGSGTPQDTYYDEVELPRYLVINPEHAFRSAREDGPHKGVDVGIGIKEVFSRDVVILLEANDDLTKKTLMSFAKDVHFALTEQCDVPIHIFERKGYTEAIAPKIDVLIPRRSRYDRELDPCYHQRFSFMLRAVGAQGVELERWVERTGLMAKGEKRRFEDRASAEAVQECASMINAAIG